MQIAYCGRTPVAGRTYPVRVIHKVNPSGLTVQWLELDRFQTLMKLILHLLIARWEKIGTGEGRRFGEHTH